MRWGSLRFRLVAAGAVAILIALGIAGAGLELLFERHLARAMSAELDFHLTQLLGGIDIGPGGRLVVRDKPSDPRFEEPLSGLYWQVSDDRDQVVRSRSLWDTALVLPLDEPGPSEVHQHEAEGPNHARLLVAERSIVLNNEGARIRVRAAVGQDFARARIAAAAFTRELSLALGLLGLVLVAATSVQVGLGLRPLALLRARVAEIRSGRLNQLPTAVPSEVAPLVEEVNALLSAQDKEIARSRSRAADLAHGFKTPLAALLADAARLRERGEAKLAQDIEAVVDNMSRHVDRELALARVRGSRTSGAPATALAPLLASLIATLARTPDAAGIRFEISVAEDLQLALDRTDLAEVLGNLLENAVRHARSTVAVSASAVPPSVVVEDDGEGIPEHRIARALERGGRLDEQAPGTGLGLSIVRDVLDAYGWRLQVGRSPRGGARMSIAPQAGSEQPTRAEAASS